MFTRWQAERDNVDWLRWEDMAIAFRDEVNICLEEIKDGLASGSLVEGNQWPYDCEKRCFGRLVKIQQQEEARQEREQETVARGIPM